MPSIRLPAGTDNTIESGGFVIYCILNLWNYNICIIWFN